MLDLLELKSGAHSTALSLIITKIDQLRQELDNCQAAANNESKSSAGDKYETGRAMMHLEQGKLTSMLNQVLKQERVLREINPNISKSKVELGSLFKTQETIFYISVSLGLIDIEPKVLCISPVSPLGQAMEGKTQGDEVTFNGKKYVIEEVA
ncbi:MAG: transcription elongation GreA/GreB family factor [Marinoscillum sp.]|jgi:transcription elongation GreA/GreB family factor